MFDTAGWKVFSSSASEASPEDNCSVSTVESKNCRIEEGPDGKLVQRCEVLRRGLRQCPGKPVEELESTREETTSGVGTGRELFRSEGGGPRHPFSEDPFETFGRFHSLMEDLSGIFDEDSRPSFPNEDGGLFPKNFRDQFERFFDEGSSHGHRHHYHSNKSDGRGGKGSKHQQKKKSFAGMGDDFQEA